MCRPVGGSREEACPGGHIGPPLRNDWRRSAGNGNWHEKTPFPAGRDGARPLQGERSRRGCPGRGVQDGGVRLGCGFRRPNFVPKFGASVMGIGPYERREGPIDHLGQRRRAGSLRRGWEEVGGDRGRNHPPKGPSTSDNPSVTAKPCQLPLHKGAFGDGGCESPRRFAPRNDSPDPLSVRGGPTGRRGNPSFLRWTGDGGSGRRGRRPLRVVAERCRDHPGSALSAERVAGQIQVLPDDLRVQHGALGPEIC